MWWTHLEGFSFISPDVQERLCSARPRMRRNQEEVRRVTATTAPRAHSRQQHQGQTCDGIGKISCSAAFTATLTGGTFDEHVLTAAAACAALAAARAALLRQPRPWPIGVQQRQYVGGTRSCRQQQRRQQQQQPRQQPKRRRLVSCGGVVCVGDMALPFHPLGA